MCHMFFCGLDYSYNPTLSMYQSHSILWVRCFCAWLLPNSTWTLGIHRSTTLDEPRAWWNKWFKKPWVLGYNMKHWVLHHIHPYIHLFTYNVYICIHMNLTKLHHKFEWILILSTPQKKTAFLSLVPSKKTTLNFHHQHLKKKQLVHVQLQTGVICKPNTFLWAWRLHMESWRRKRQWMRTKCQKKT